ncbi:MAG: hypothetical protein HOP08_01025 [Cyclobacteriaceae bacterium]|nr:hypothetical protein [Cyclobacteriaceae bacterium]
MPLDRSKFQKTKAIALYKQFILYEFREVGLFLFEMDNALTAKVSEIEDFAKTMIDSSDREDTRSEFIDNLLEDPYQMGTTFKQLLFNSSFISVFAMFENAIQGICRHSLGEKFQVKHKNIVVGYKKDLENFFKCSLDSDVWNEILLFRGARNKLVHSSLQLTSTKESPMGDELKNFLKKVGHIKFKEDDNFVVSDRRFLEKFCNVAETYLKFVFKEIGSQARKID